MENEISAILEDNENVVWEWKQDLKTTIISAVFAVGILFIIWWIFSTLWNGEVGSCEINGRPGTPEECARILNWIASGAYLLGLIAPIGAYLYYRVTVYVITNKRVIIKSGLIGADMRSIFFEKIKSTFVNVGILGKIFGTGTIMIDSGNITQTKNGTQIAYDKFANIDKPYEVYKILQSHLSNRKEGLESGRADFESNKDKYKDFIQETEKMKVEVQEEKKQDEKTPN